MFERKEKASRFWKTKGLIACAAVFLALTLCVHFGAWGWDRSWKQVFAAFGLADFQGEASRYPMSVHVLDVGKADAILVECEGKYLLVDGGTYGYGEEVCQYLARQGVQELEYVINTHPDEDHIGGIAAVLARFKVKEFLSPYLPEQLIPNTPEFSAVAGIIDKKSIPVRNSGKGELFYLGNLKVEVLGPVGQYDSLNNNSLILRLVYGETSFLLMGDAEKEAELDLVAFGNSLESDVLKIGHHGSRTSTTQELLDAVRPDFAVVSVGPDRNNLPNQEVLERVRGAGAELYRTDIDGPVLFVSDGIRIIPFTEP